MGANQPGEQAARAFCAPESIGSLLATGLLHSLYTSEAPLNPPRGIRYADQFHEMPHVKEALGLSKNQYTPQSGIVIATKSKR